MSFCINPNCPKPNDPLNDCNPICRQCGSQLLLQDRYRVSRLLGEGGFGKTYEVDDRGTPKVLKVLLIDANKAVSLFQQEASVLSLLHHPGIPRVEPDGYFTFLPKDAGEQLHCLVMEKIDGVNLEEWLKERQSQPCTQEQAIAWLRQLAEILHQVHEKLYFHRDIKPSNIMLRPNGQLALIDFGSAREVTMTYLAKVSGGSDVTGIISPGYTPIEQANGKAVPQSDFFALGRTFVYLLTGKSPNDFPEDPRSGELLWHHRANNIVKPITDLIDHLMAPFPGNRPHNAQMILQCLEVIESALRLTELSSQKLEPANFENIPRSPSSKTKIRSPLEKLRANVAKFKKELLVSCGILVLGFAGFQVYNDVGNFGQNAVQSSDREGTWLSNAAIESQSTRLVSESPQSTASKKDSSVPSPTGNINGVNAIAIAPDGRTLVSGSRNGTIQLWQLDSGKVKTTFKGHVQGVNSIAIGADGETLASGGEDNTVKLWNLKTGKLSRTLKGHKAWVSSVAFSADGQTLVSGSFDQTIKLWDLGTGKVAGETPEPRTLKGHNGWVFSVAVVPRSPQDSPATPSLLASGSFDNTIKIWNLKTGELIRTLKGHNERVFALAISPDGSTIASGSGDGTIQLWRLGTGRLVRSIKGHSDWIRCIAFSPDGATLASGSSNRDGTIKLWDLGSGELQRTFKGHSDHVRSLAFSPDGKKLVSASYDNTIKLWTLGK